MVASVVITALLGASCRKDAAEQQRQAQKATEEAEQKASETTITSAEMSGAGAGSGAEEQSEEASEARDRAFREQAEAVIATRNEQNEYRGKLEHALDNLDAKRREAKKRGASYVKAIDARREVLKHHLESLDRVTDTQWPTVKASIDRDLKDQTEEGR